MNKRRYTYQVQDGGKPFVFFDVEDMNEANFKAMYWENEMRRKLKFHSVSDPILLSQKELINHHNIRIREMKKYMLGGYN